MQSHSIRITYIKQRKNKRYLFFESKKKYWPVHGITEPVLCIFYSKKGKIRERGFMPDKKTGT